MNHTITNRFAIGKDVELSSYYLYLTTFLSSDSIGQRKVAEELSKTFIKNPDSWKILCMLVDVDSEYKIYSERLHALEKQFYEEKSHSIWFYFQAFRCYRDKSSSLKKLGEFEIRVLLFAVRHKLMTRELALYTAQPCQPDGSHLINICTMCLYSRTTCIMNP